MIKMSHQYCVQAREKECVGKLKYNFMDESYLIERLIKFKKYLVTDELKF